MTNTNNHKFTETIKDWPEPARSEAKAGLMEIVILRLVEKLDNSLSPEKQDELETELEKVNSKKDQVPAEGQPSPADEMINWFSNNVPNFSELMDTTISEVDAQLSETLEANPEYRSASN